MHTVARNLQIIHQPSQRLGCGTSVFEKWTTWNRDSLFQGLNYDQQLARLDEGWFQRRNPEFLR